jgi:hypothetical protein
VDAVEGTIAHLQRVNIFTNFLVAPGRIGRSVLLRCNMNARSQPAPHRLIREIGSGLYLSTDGRWVRDEQEAFDFPDLRTALATCEQMQDRGVEMILVFDRGNASHYTPLRA